MSLVSKFSYSHTRHFVSIEQFDGYVKGLLQSDQMDETKKQSLQQLLDSEIWGEIRQSSYWRHNLFNGGLSGPFTEYFACFNPQWKVDFWGAKVQPIEITYLSQHAIPRAYQSAVAKTQNILKDKVKELVNEGQQKVRIATLACGTMYDVLGANYEDKNSLSFSGFDVDGESLRLAREKGNRNGYASESLELQESDVVKDSLKEKEYDAVVCNGFSFYVSDENLSLIIEKAKRALKPNGIFIMSFIQPPSYWQMSDKEKEVNNVVKPILDAFPKKWSSNLRTSEQVISLTKKGGLDDVSVIAEEHGIHPLILAHNRPYERQSGLDDQVIIKEEYSTPLLLLKGNAADT